MSRQIQIRRGTSAEHNNFTGAIGEVTMDTTNNTLHVHDGVTVGGHEVLKKNEYLSHITNCVTEIPQDIKLELNNGTLTLKAGSKIYVPGTGMKYDVINITADRNTTSTSNGKLLVLVTSSGTTLTATSLASCVSGATDSLLGQAYHVWYDTTNNVVNYYSADGSTVGGTRSLPVGIVTVSNGSITSIDQIFNDFGYIGSTIFVLPGVKALIPNGLNADGSLKSISVTFNNIITYTPSGSGCLFTDGSTLSRRSQYYIVKNQTAMNSINADGLYYVIDENRCYSWAGGAGTKYSGFCVLGSYTYASSKVVSLTPNATFHAVDYNDFNSLMTNTKPITASSAKNSIVTTTGISKNRNGYVKFGNGVIIQWGEVTATGASRTITLPTAFSGVNYMVSLIPEAPSGSLYSLMLSDKTSSTVTVTSTGDAANYSFNWIAVGY